MVRRLHVLGFAILFVCLTALVGVTGDVPTSEATATPSSGIDARGAQESVTVQETADGFSRATFTLTVYENGSVRWMETYARSLNESESQEFEAYAEEFNTTETELYRNFVTDGESLASIGSQSTNRTMQARNFRKRAYVDRDAFTDGTQGKVEMSFLWTNLSRVSGDRVILGEAFEGGLYIGPNQRLTVEPGPGLAFDSFDPDPDSMGIPGSPVESESMTWVGEYEFTPQRPLITFQPRSATTTATLTTTQTTTQTTTDPGVTPSTSPTPTPAPAETGGDSGGALFVVALIVLLLAVGTAVVYRTIGTTGSEGTGETSTDDPSSGGGGAAAGAVQSSAASETASTVTDEDLLTDTDRVQSLLRERGGRMRQSEIVEATDWSKSKVSMLLSDMEDDDEITKLRVGRENIVSLPGHEPDAAGSPFEDEE